jgi:hypothetical protein
MDDAAGLRRPTPPVCLVAPTRDNWPRQPGDNMVPGAATGRLCAAVATAGRRTMQPTMPEATAVLQSLDRSSQSSAASVCLHYDLIDMVKMEGIPNSQTYTDAEGRRWQKCVRVAVVNSASQLLVVRCQDVNDVTEPEPSSSDGGGTAPTAAQKDEDAVRLRWVFPAGPMHNDGETPLQAAGRVIHEQLGLTSEEVNPVASMLEIEAVLHECPPHSNGCVGLHVAWCLFRCADAQGDRDASKMCQLDGGRFTCVSWQNYDQLGSQIDMGRGRGGTTPSATLCSWLRAHTRAHHRAVSGIDFSGRWARLEARGEALEALRQALEARGHSPEAAAQHAVANYVQAFARVNEGEDKEGEMEGGGKMGVGRDGGGVWQVTSYAPDGITPRRVLRYPLGDWEELHGYNSTLFGAEPGVVPRRTMWLPEPDADDHTNISGCDGDGSSRRSRRRQKQPATEGGHDSTSVAGAALPTSTSFAQRARQLGSYEAAECLGLCGEWAARRAGVLAYGQLAHVTTSVTSLGVEEARRFMRGGRLVLRRRFVRKSTGTDAVPVISEEIFSPVEPAATPRRRPSRQAPHPRARLSYLVPMDPNEGGRPDRVEATHRRGLFRSWPSLSIDSVQTVSSSQSTSHSSSGSLSQLDSASEHA